MTVINFIETKHQRESPVLIVYGGKKMRWRLATAAPDIRSTFSTQRGNYQLVPTAETTVFTR